MRQWVIGAVVLGLAGTAAVPGWADVTLELAASGRVSSGEIERERNDQTDPNKDDLSYKGFGGQVSLFLPGLKDGGEYQGEPIALREFLQHPTTLRGFYGVRGRDLEPANSDTTYTRDDTTYGGELALYTPVRNWATGLGGRYQMNTREYSADVPGYTKREYDRTTINAHFTQYLSRFVRLRATYEHEEFEKTAPSSEFHERKHDLVGGNLKLALGHYVSLEVGAAGGKQKRKLSEGGNDQEWRAGKGTAELGFYFGKYVSLLLGGDVTRFELDEENMGDVEVSETNANAHADLNIWFGEHFGILLRGFANAWVDETKGTSNSDSKDTWSDAGGIATVALRL